VLGTAHKLTPKADVERTLRWSRAKLIGFRLAFAIAVLSIPRFAIFIPVHLEFDAVKRPLASALNPFDQFEWQTTSTIGAFLVSEMTGGASTRDMMVRFRADRTASALPDMLGLLTLALLITIVWTVMDQRRANYLSLDRWMRVYLRYALGTVMLSYAFIKVIPTQFGFLTPGELLRPFGELSRFRVLWNFMAVSSGYTIFTGLVELLGATLLFFRRTTLLGSLVLACVLTNVVVMDLAYRIGAVYYATVMLLLDILILAPYLQPLFVILLVRGNGELPAEPSGAHRWWHSSIAKTVLICILAFPLIEINIKRRGSFFGSGHLVYGLFEVADFVRNGNTPLANDSETWKRVASDPRDGTDGVLVQFANGDLRRIELTDDAEHRVWTIRDPTRAGTLHYVVRQDGIVSLEGRIGSDAVAILLRPVDVNRFFPLLRPPTLLKS
jgi:hypothetical protein